MARKSYIAVFQDLTVTAVARDAHVLTVHVTDAARAPHRITLSLTDSDVARDMADQVASWRDNSQPVSYVRTGETGALIDERAVFERSMGDDYDPQWY